ncbi:MAG: hypothetical protein Q8935_25210 [Bacillota bacterium]|jgi:hypothetical protein|nr:hypothetical protein [Bacillota bacterium]MDP4155186.1 hypothetical protein [Bacillota bacterium]
MKANVSVPLENVNLLMEIAHLKTKVTELYNQNGPGSPDYISLSLKLSLLINEYIDEKIVDLM